MMCVEVAQRNKLYTQVQVSKLFNHGARELRSTQPRFHHTRSSAYTAKLETAYAHTLRARTLTPNVCTHTSTHTHNHTHIHTRTHTDTSIGESFALMLTHIIRCGFEINPNTAVFDRRRESREPLH